MNSITPSDSFPYRDAYLKGRPQHQRFDPFRMKHPLMDLNRRAKIFHSFDALKGFGDAVAAKEVLYTTRRELSEEEREELDRCLTILKDQLPDSRTARQLKLRVSITYFVPCSDPGHEAFGCGGRYRTISGICRYVDPDISRTICIDDIVIRLEDVVAISDISSTSV